MIIPVILSGGAGTRLWPLSRELYPKQLLPLASDKTMLQETALRLVGFADVGSPIIVCNQEHRFMVAEQLKQIGVQAASIMLEPIGRNTAPAVALAAMQSMKNTEDPLLLVLPADHVIKNKELFHQAVQRGVEAAKRGHLVTFGVVPNKAETGYGYIHAGDPIEEGVLSVRAFVEKPDVDTANKYLKAGDYYWNSGMFLFRAARYLEELQHFAPDMLAACEKSFSLLQSDFDFLRLDEASFVECPPDSIDYAVMEKTDSAVVIPFDGGWSDIGSWSALWETGERDAEGNKLQGEVLVHDTRNCLLHSSSRLIATVGLDDCVVVETSDAILVAHKDRVQDVKVIVDKLRQGGGRPETLLHRRVNRPWGAYEGVDQGERFQVKRITVDPGASLSSQKHYHRAEHWIVVKGTAQVTCGDEVLTLCEDQSTYIPLGQIHRLENPGKIPLEIIEVQSGSYLGEDDIVRFEDQYGRKVADNE